MGRLGLLALLAGLAGPVVADIRAHTRPTGPVAPAMGPAPARMSLLTLAHAPVARYPLQTWLRTAARLSEDGQTLATRVCHPLADRLRPGQRVIAYPPERRTLTDQGRVLAAPAEGEPGCHRLRVRLAAPAPERGRIFLLEVIIPRGRRLAVPREALIETGIGTRVYVRDDAGHWHPRAVLPGLEGERYTEIRRGLREGESVVTLGSFFIHAEYQWQQVTNHDAYYCGR